MLNIGVVGLGNWGTALANHLAHNNHNVLGWSIDEGVAEGINEKHINPIYQKDVVLNENLKATKEIRDLDNVDMLLLVVPSCALSKVVPQLKIRKDMLVVSAIKGLEAESLKTPISYVKDYFNMTDNMAAISGPSFAKDIVRLKPCGVVAASTSEETARRVADIFTSDTMRVYFSTDPQGVEIGAVVKNVIALATGVCDGLDLGDSARAVLITRGLAEMMRLGVAMGGQERTLYGLSGLGDLILTATCDASRNRTVGKRLGQGESLDYIVKTLGSVAESVTTSPLVEKLAEKYNVQMPIVKGINQLLRGEVKAEDLVKTLLNRPLKFEF